MSDSAEAKAASDGSHVASLRKNLHFNPAALLPGAAHAKLARDDHNLAALDPKNPTDLAELINVVKALQTEADTVTRTQRDIQLVNKGLRADIDFYSRQTLPHAVMTKFDRDTTGSGKEELMELRKVAHKKTQSGTWLKVDEEPHPVSKDIEAKLSQGADKIFRSGWMYKEGGMVKSWKRRLFILRGSSIEYYTKSTDDKPKGVITLDTCTISSVQSRDGVSKPCMELVFSQKGRKWRFVAEKVSDNRRWFSAIRNRIVTLSHIRRCDQVKQKPDPRVLDFLNTVPSSVSIQLPGKGGDKPKKPKTNAKQEGWPVSHPLILNDQRLSLDTVSVVAVILSDSTTCPGGGVSRLECVNAGLTSVELEILCKALANSDFNVQAQKEKERTGSLERKQTSQDLAPDYAPSEEHGVQAINFSSNTLVDNDPKLPAVHALATVLSVTTVLTELALMKCHLGDTGVEVLAAVFPNMTCSLRRLLLSHNGITDKGASTLAASLSKGVPLRMKQGDEETSHFRQHTLEELNLSHNEIGNAGGQALGQLVAVDKCALFRVNLQRNKIGDDGAAAIAQALRQNTSVKYLDLSENPLSPTGSAASALTHTAQLNNTLVELKFLNFILNDDTLNAMRLVATFGIDS